MPPMLSRQIWMPTSSVCASEPKVLPDRWSPGENWCPSCKGDLEGQFLASTSWRQYLLYGKFPTQKKSVEKMVNVQRVWQMSTLCGLVVYTSASQTNMQTNHLRILLKCRFSLSRSRGKENQDSVVPTSCLVWPALLIHSKASYNPTRTPSL